MGAASCFEARVIIGNDLGVSGEDGGGTGAQIRVANVFEHGRVVVEGGHGVKEA